VAVGDPGLHAGRGRVRVNLPDRLVQRGPDVLLGFVPLTKAEGPGDAGLSHLIPPETGVLNWGDEREERGKQ
jgi:hypothetical protein